MIPYLVGPTESRLGGAAGAGWYGVPDVPTSYGRRPRLLRALDRSDGCPLVLVSAPAGTGKTALLADWVSAGGPRDPTAWVTFEGMDAAFWPGVIGALEALGVRLTPRAASGGDVPLERRTRRMIAESVARLPARVTVVVDGYDLLSADVAADLDFLLRHSGHRLRLVMLTRVDPALPLYRYRLEDMVCEVRMADLAFTDREAGVLLERAGVTLGAESVHALNTRTRGWAAGLRFAARMLLPRQDRDAAVAEIVGDTGNIAEYLVGEVLAAQTPAVRSLLLATSIPETIQPGLALALAGPSAPRMLAALTRDNVFIEQVPGHRGSYRYHPFFRDMLRAELAHESPEEMGRLQRTAAEWFAGEGLVTPSVVHFAAIDAWEDAAAAVVEALAVGELLVEDGASGLARSFGRMPAAAGGRSATIVRATLALGAADASGFADELSSLGDAAEEQTSGQRWAEDLTVRVLQAVGGRSAADPDEAMALATAAEQALETPGSGLSVGTHPQLIGLVQASAGIAAVRRGDLAEAVAIFEDGISVAGGPGAEALLVEGLGHLAIIAACRGELSQAAELAARALGLVERVGSRATDWSAAATVALAWVETERYDLRAAGDHVRSVDQADPPLGDPIPHAVLALVRSRLKIAHGDRLGALGELEHAPGRLVDAKDWLGDRLRTELAQLRIAAGQPAVALVEAEDLATCPETALVVALAKLELGDLGAADDSLSTVLSAHVAVPTQVSGWLAECTRSLRDGESDRAEAALRRALELGAPERLRRPFHEAPVAVRQLLVRDAELCAQHGWLFEVSGRPSQRLADQRTGGRSPAAAVTTDASGPVLVVEELTAKEAEVLGHLASLLTTEEIAGVMYISVNTVRTHVRNILRKLGVTRRNAAVRRAHELQLLRH
jgi:LuxR family transcriptional regulator, maltose regulon positive regulatory protein